MLPEVKPKVEEGGRHPSPCQFTINTPKVEPAPPATPLSLGLKPGQTVMGSRDTRVGVGTGPFPSSGHTAEKGPFGATGGTPAHLLNPSSLSGSAGSSLLEKFELESGTLTLPSGNVAPGDELDKMESSLVASELPLLIEDLWSTRRRSCRRGSSFQHRLCSLHSHSSSSSNTSIPSFPYQALPRPCPCHMSLGHHSSLLWVLEVPDSQAWGSQ